MKRSTFFGKHSIRRHQLAVLAATLMAGVFGPAQACDYCNQGGGIVCDTGCDSGCDSCGSGAPSGPIFQTLDAVAGGIERFLGLDQCGSGCDSACDACDYGMVDELMITPAPQHHHSEPALPNVPPESYSQPAQPYTQPAQPYSQPAQPYSQPAQPYSQPEHAMPVPEPEMRPLPPVQNDQQDDGSLFDTLNNPFSDDEVRWTPKTRRSMEPSAYHKRKIPVQAMRPSSSYLNGRSTQATHPQQRQMLSQRSDLNSVKRATARRPVTNAASGSRSTYATQRQQTHSHHQVRLSKAPSPQSRGSHSTSPARSSGHKTFFETAKHLISR